MPAVEVERIVVDLTSIGIDHVVLDLARLRYMDSRGLQLLLGLRDDADARSPHARAGTGPEAVAARVRPDRDDRSVRLGLTR
jgi:anti-anti-sigma regulatory factor